MSPPQPRVGDPDIILDDPRFVITGEHARGGQSIIYKATDTWLGRQVAIKVSVGRDPASWHRLAQEASILSRLDHPWILPVYHSGTMVSGAPYLATRLVDGVTLEARLKREPAAWPTFLRHIADVADAMSYAHGKGVVHRDLTPGNVLVDAQGHTVVIDWGLAREAAGSLDGGDGDASSTGSPGYRAPETVDGGAGDARSDVYSLGAILYRMCAGRAAHPSVPSGAELERDLAAASPELRAVVARATARAPADRYASMADLGADLAATLPPDQRLERSLQAGSRRSKILGAVAVFLLVAAMVLAGMALLNRDERPRLARHALQTTAAWTGNFGVTLIELDPRTGTVRGVYEHEQGTLKGRLDGSVLEIHWCESPWVSAEDHGPARLAYAAEAPDLPSFAGPYRYDEGPRSGSWILHAAPVGSASADLRKRLSEWTWRCPD